MREAPASYEQHCAPDRGPQLQIKPGTSKRDVCINFLYSWLCLSRDRLLHTSASVAPCTVDCHLELWAEINLFFPKLIFFFLWATERKPGPWGSRNWQSRKGRHASLAKSSRHVCFVSRFPHVQYRVPGLIQMVSVSQTEVGGALLWMLPLGKLMGPFTPGKYGCQKQPSALQASSPILSTSRIFSQSISYKHLRGQC